MRSVRSHLDGKCSKQTQARGNTAQLLIEDFPETTASIGRSNLSGGVRSLIPLNTPAYRSLRLTQSLIGVELNRG
jgi:hypothetical protein